MAEVHQIWHGDSIELSQKFKHGRIDCIITDPPFGVNNQSNSAVTTAGKAAARKIANDETPEIAIATFKAVMDVLLPRTKDNSDVYVFTSHQVLKEWLVMCDDFMATHAFRRKAILVWQKDGPGMGDLDTWGMGCEFILYFKKGNRPRTAKRRNNIISTPQLRPGELIHPHEKPGGLLELLIEHSTDRGDFIVDPFGGSGSLVRAARNIGRNAVAIEYDRENYEKALSKLNSAGGLGF